eukprot:TRINITY_DN1453_c0_g1_i2.p1 TRINITY_DN1453_c0_g1~~TRINITY_DN1453_c0_g1_i2.p1  ORF type:complete len:124 (-),score=56.65 TRINITY_DN1453_c0_g1_i2:312-635(-)
MQAIEENKIEYNHYTTEHDLPGIAALIEKELSEPYSVFTYRYFINNWPKLCWMAIENSTIIGVIVCKLEQHKGMHETLRGYIAMLVVHPDHRKKNWSNLLSLLFFNC